MLNDAAELDRDLAEFPDGWEVRPLSMLCREVIERVDPAAMNGDLGGHYIGLEHIGQGTGQLESVGNATDVVSQKSRFHAGDILYGKLRPNLRKVTWPDFGGVCSTDIIVLRAKPNADPAFLFQVLQSEPLVAHAVATAAGTKMPRTHARSILSYEIATPPLDEQRRIAEVLRSVDEAIAAAQQAADHSRALQASLITAQCFGHGYEMVSLGDVLTDIRYGTSAKCDASEADGHPVLRIPNVVNGRVELDDLKYASVSDPDLRRFSLEPDDIVVVRTNGNPAYVGRSALIVKGMMTCMFASYLIRMRFDARRAWSPYIYATLNSQPVREKLLKAATTSAGNYNINTASLKEITIPLPRLEAQHQISEVIQAATEAATACENEVNSKQQVKAALLSDLLSGRVRVPVPVIAASGKTVPPAFKRAVFAAEIVHQLHNDNRFGSVKHEKIVHLCELHLGLQDDLDRHAYKEAAGPYDPKARRSVERIFQQQKWFDATKPDGNRVVYVPLEKAGGHAEYFDRYFGDQKSAIQSIIDLLRPLDTPQCEIVATLYAVWNDFLIDGQQPTDDEIVASVLQWHPRKREIAEDRWRKALPWMRQKGLIPKGMGEKTRVVQG